MHKYDVDVDGCINMQELAYCLEDAGLLEHLHVEVAGRYVEDMFVYADADRDGRIALPEFEMVLKMVQRDSSMGSKLDVMQNLQKKLLSPVSWGSNRAALIHKPHGEQPCTHQAAGAAPSCLLF
jgi:hypothetical protein